MSNDSEAAPSYHDVHVTTAKMPRTRLFDLPFGYELTCTRVSGWVLWGPTEKQVQNRMGPFVSMGSTSGPTKIAGEYDDGLIIDVAGHVICDSLTRRTSDA